MKQKYLILLIFSCALFSVNAQSYANGYSPERVSMIEELFNKSCNGTQTYCDCITSNVMSSIPFNKLRDPESTESINTIIRACQEQYKQFPYDPSRPPKIQVSSYVTFNSRADSTLFEGDTLELNYSIINEGIGTAYVPALVIDINGPAGNYLDYKKRIQLNSDLEPLDRVDGVVTIVPERLLEDDTLSISYEVIEGNKWSSNKEIINLWSIASLDENKSVSFIPKSEFDGVRYTVDFSYKNIGTVPLRYPRLDFALEQGARVSASPWINLSRSALHKFDFDPSTYPKSGVSVASVIYPGEVIYGDFQFTLEQGFENNSIQLTSTFIEEDLWKDEKTFEISVNSTSSDQIVNVQRLSSSQTSFIALDPVDNIKQSSSPQDNHFAVIIGNENYTSTNARNVDFAVRDAQVFKLYSTNILGVPQDNVELVTNGSAVQMAAAINSVIKRAKQRDEPVVYFYYAGHGWPTPDTQEPLLVPADIGPNQLSSAMKLNEIMASFRQDEDLELLAFVDACYASEKFSEDTRTFVIEIKEPLVKGKQVLFSAVSAKQEANKHEESGHGVFTYYLLKSLKDNPKITIEELNEALGREVVDYVVKKGQKEQTPSVHIAPEIKSQSNRWRIRK